MRYHKSQCSVLIIVTNKNHTKERLTNHKFAEKLHEPPHPPPPPQIIKPDLHRDPNGTEKNEFPLEKQKNPMPVYSLGLKKIANCIAN